MSDDTQKRIDRGTNAESAGAPPVALTIAGLDPSGGAGVVADINTFRAFGFYACAAVTSLTFQNTVGVFGAEHASSHAVRRQVEPVVADFSVACAKTGMLPTGEIIRAVAELFRTLALPAPVVDPVVRSTSGYDLIDDHALDLLIRELLPLARVVTPNIPEAERITRRRIRNESEMLDAARALRDMGARAALIKGGHLTGDALDLLLDENGDAHRFRTARIDTTSTHGTGCTLAAAISCGLGRGLELPAAVDAAKRYVTDAIRTAPKLGRGFGPLNHAVNLVAP